MKDDSAPLKKSFLTFKDRPTRLQKGDVLLINLNNGTLSVMRGGATHHVLCDGKTDYYLGQGTNPRFAMSILQLVCDIYGVQWQPRESCAPTAMLYEIV